MLSPYDDLVTRVDAFDRVSEASEPAEVEAKAVVSKAAVRDGDGDPPVDDPVPYPERAVVDPYAVPSIEDPVP